MAGDSSALLVDVQLCPVAAATPLAAACPADSPSPLNDSPAGVHRGAEGITLVAFPGTQRHRLVITATLGAAQHGKTGSLQVIARGLGRESSTSTDGEHPHALPDTGSERGTWALAASVVLLLSGWVLVRAARRTHG